MTFDDGSPPATIPRGARIVGHPDLSGDEVRWDGVEVFVAHSIPLPMTPLMLALLDDPCQFRHEWNWVGTRCVRCGFPAPVEEPSERIVWQLSQAEEAVALYRAEKKRKGVPPWPKPASWWCKTPDAQGPEAVAFHVRRVGPYHLHATVEREYGSIPAKMRGRKGP